MANIAMTVKGGGHYDEAQWRNQIVLGGALSDWWIHEPAWKQLQDGLRTVQFDVHASRRAIGDMITAVAKDLPAAVDRRFAGPRGIIGNLNYQSAPVYYRLGRSAVMILTELARASDQPSGSRDIELMRPRPGAATTGAAAQGAGQHLPLIKDVQPLRDGSYAYTNLLKNLLNENPMLYDRDTFELNYALDWIQNA